MKAGPLLTLLLVAASQASARDLAEIREQGVLRVLLVPNEREPQFFSRVYGEAPGFDREILDGFCQAQGVTLEVVPVSGWDQIVPDLLAGKGDLIASRVTDTPQRRQRIDFTVEVFPTRTVVVSFAPTPEIRNIAQLLQQRIGTIRGTSMQEDLQAFGIPAEKVDLSIVPGEMLRALESGKITAGAWGIESALVPMSREPRLRLGMFLGPPRSLAYGVRREARGLRIALNTHIGAFRRSGAWQKLVAKYFGDAAPEILKKARE